MKDGDHQSHYGHTAVTMEITQLTVCTYNPSGKSSSVALLCNVQFQAEEWLFKERN